jgi:hypothetical protein
MTVPGSSAVIDWLRRPDNIFRAALFLSALFHLLLLVWLKFPEHLLPLQIGGGHAALTVQLTPRTRAAVPDIQPMLFTNDLRLELLAPAPSPRPELPVAEFVAGYREAAIEKPQVEVAEQAEPIAPEQPAPPPAFVDRREPVLRPGMATVFLRINEDGRVVQMIWDQLPVVTREELVQMEMELLERYYPLTGSAYSVAETVIVPKARVLNKAAP